MTPDERLARYARLAVEVGVNLQPGQLLRIAAHPDHLPFARAIAEVAYEAGARYVEVLYADPHVRRSRIRHAPEDTLDWSPPWTLALVDELAATNGAMIAITGDPEPELFARARPGADREGAAAARRRAHAGRRRATGGSPGRSSATRTRAGPKAVFGEPDVERLWEAVDDRDPARRGRPGRRLAHAHREAEGARRTCSTNAASTPFASAAPAPTSPSA